MQLFPAEIMADRKQLDNVEYFKYLCSLNTNDARFTRENKSRIVLVKAAFNKKNTLFASKLKLNLGEKTSEVLHWKHSFKSIVLKLGYFEN
jgi:hypothetical protein